jgi:hypothetical protein
MAGTAIAALLLAASPALAAQRYAAPTGGGTACSSGSPCTIQQVFTGATTGDEIILNPGDYPVATTLFLPANGFAHGVQGQPAPRIHFTATHYIHTGNPGSRLSYIQIDGPTSAPLEVDQNTQADQVYVHATGGDACLVYGTLIDSVCWTSGASGEAINGAATSAYTPVLRNVTAEATASGGVGVEYHTSAPGSIILTAVNLIAHGTLLDLKVQADTPANTTINVDHSNYANPLSSGTGAHINSTNQQAAAPLFSNAATGDFRETPGSPTIDAGVTSAANGPFDLLGLPRTINGATDIGAYEYDPFAGVTLANQKSKVKKRKAKVTIGCPIAAATSCTGTLSLTFAKGKTAGSTPFAMGTGATETLKVRISKKALKRLDKKGKLGTQASAAATDAAGVAATTTARVKLKS